MHKTVSLATSLAQAITKRKYDAARDHPSYKVGDQVLLHVGAANRLTPHFAGPYVITSVTPDGNFVKARYFTTKTDEEPDGPFHVSRLIHFNATRADGRDLALFQVESGSGVANKVLAHRGVGDQLQFQISWYGTDIRTWLPASAARDIDIVRDYCTDKDINMDTPTRTRAPTRPRARRTPTQ
jgi:hypothetical protein